MNQTPALALVRRLSSRISAARMRYGISIAARTEMRREQRLPRDTDVPIDRAITEALAWIGRAQDNSSSADGGVARHYCLVTGWGASYPETTGYIVPTLIREGRSRCQPFWPRLQERDDRGCGLAGADAGCRRMLA